MSVIEPEVLREKIEKPVEGLSPRAKREVVSAIERAFFEVKLYGRIPPGKNGGCMVVASMAGIPLQVIFEGKSEDATRAKKLFNEATTMASMLAMNSERVCEFTRGAIRGQHFIISFAGFGSEADEAVSLFVALQLNELNREDCFAITAETKNSTFKEVFTRISDQNKD